MPSKLAFDPYRRRFLRSGGILLVYFGAGGLGLFGSGAGGTMLPPPRRADPKLVGGCLAIAPDGRVTIYTSKIDWGTGLRAAFRQLVAEELDVAIERIDMIESDTAITPDQGGTGGSYSIARAGVTIRQAAATARAALLEAASTGLGVPGSTLSVIDGVIKTADGRSVSYAKLVTERRLEMPIDPKAPLKSPEHYRIVGTSVPRPDAAAKTAATHLYVHDLRVPGMLHARVIRPRAHGARLLTVDESSIRDIPGARIVREKDFLAVVAESEWSAVRAARALKVTWSEWANFPEQERLYDAVKSATVARDQDEARGGDVSAALAGAARVLRASYAWPIQNHASLGPSCAVADVRADAATIWTASSRAHSYQKVFAEFLGLPLERVRLVYLDGAGAYGMNGAEDAAADAAIISRALGRPVRVQWTREDEHRWEPKGPPQPIELIAGLDAAGNIVAWRTETWLPETTKNLATIPLMAPNAAGLKQPQGMRTGRVSDHLDPPYTVAALHTRVHWLKETPFRPSHIRSPGKVANSFAIESFTDEIAAAVGADPLAWRLERLSDARGREVLRRTAERFGWRPGPAGSRRSSGERTMVGQGISYVHYKHKEAYVALAVEVEVDRATGAIRVTRAVCGQDCGLLINPDGARAQIEGGIIQTISRTLKEEVRFDRAQVTSLDWASYPLLSFPEVPAIDVVLIDRRDQPPLGVGEPMTTTVAGAIANAVFDATGVRLRTVPFTPPKLQGALARHPTAA